MALRQGTFVTIQEWMVTNYHLRGNELLLYALLWGFSQDGLSWYTGRQAYLAEWLGCTPKTVRAVIDALVNKGLVERNEKDVNGVRFVDYRAVRPEPFAGGGQPTQEPEEEFTYGGEFLPRAGNPEPSELPGVGKNYPGVGKKLPTHNYRQNNIDCGGSARERARTEGLYKDDRRQCFEAYENDIGQLSTSVADAITDWLSRVEPDLICAAIAEAAKNNARSWNYINAILKNAFLRNVKTKAAWDAENSAFEQKKQREAPPSGTRRGAMGGQNVMPDGRRQPITGSLMDDAERFMDEWEKKNGKPEYQ